MWGYEGIWNVSKTFFSLLFLFWKNEGRLMQSSCCLCIRHINLRMPEPIIMKLGIYIMTPEPISTAYFINPSHQSVCLYMYPLSLLGNGSVKRYRENEYTRNKRRIVGGVVLYAICVLCGPFVLPELLVIFFLLVMRNFLTHDIIFSEL
jgi:hypothetical protein